MNLTTLNVLDGLIVVILGWNFIRGFNKGFIEEVVSVAGLALSIYLSYQLATPVASLIAGKPDQTSTIVTGILLFGTMFVATKYVAFYLNKKLNETGLGVINNILGFLLGILRGWLIASVFVFLIATLAPDSYLIKKSSLGGLAVPVIDKVINILPLRNRKNDPFLRNWERAKKTLWRNFILNKRLKRKNSVPSNTNTGYVLNEVNQPI